MKNEILPVVGRIEVVLRTGLFAVIGLACSALNAFAYSDGDVIAYFPFDDDYQSVVNTDKNPSTISTFGTVSIVTGGAACDAVGAGNYARLNTGYLDTVKGRVAIDLSKFGIDESITQMTIEFFAKMEDGDVSNWAQQLMFGVLTDEPSGTCSPSSAKPYYLDLERNSSGVRAGYFKFQFLKAGAVTTTSVSPPEGFLYNGTWQHVALVYHNNSAGTQGMFDVYVNHTKVGTAWAGDGNTWKGVTLGEGEKLWLFLGREQSGLHCRFDELRISCGALDSSRFLRRVSDAATPQDGDALMHLKFDGSLASEVHNGEDWGPKLLSGTEGYSTDIRSDCIHAYVGDREVILSNAQCCAAKGDLKLSCPYWAMQDANLTSATLEFFIQCEGSLADWATPIMFTGGSGTPMPFIVQIGGPASGDARQRYYLRADAAHALVSGKGVNDSQHVTCYVPANLGHPNDGKWHHVAMTVKERAAGDSEIKFYFDYNHVGGTGENGTGDFAWRGLRLGDYMAILKAQKIDEFRITKGVLPVEKFMRQVKGLIIVVK